MCSASRLKARGCFFLAKCKWAEPKAKENQEVITILVAVGMAVQLAFLRTAKLLEGQVQHLAHQPLLRPRDPIAVVLPKTKHGRGGEAATFATP